MEISTAEWQVMHVIWERQPIPAADVIQALTPESGWSHRTVRTLLARLVEKRVLEARPDGNRYIYRARIGRERCVRTASRSFLKQVFAGDTESLLMHFVREGDISESQIDELKRLLDNPPRRGSTS